MQRLLLVCRGAWFALIAILAFVPDSHAQESSADESQRAACIQAYDENQVLRRAKRLREAKEALLVCAQPSCPQVVVVDCARWLKEVNASQPTVVFAVRDGEGHDLQATRITIDGTVVAERVVGSAVEIDPGPHVIRFEVVGAAPIERKVVILEGEKNRLIEVKAATEAPIAPEPTRAPAEPKDEVSSSKWTRPAPILLGSVAVLGAASFAYFGLKARNEVDDMEDSCAPNCTDGDVDGARTKALVADISLGVAIAAAAGAVIVLSTEDQEGRERVDTRVSIAPGGLFLSGAF